MLCVDRTSLRLLLGAALPLLWASSARSGLVGLQMLLSYLAGSVLVLNGKHRRVVPIIGPGKVKRAGPKQQMQH